ncbi:MAG: N-acetylneuraminate synthase family protein, partial [Alphaproteobacteria bacterium]|nr:N-acetylneuraminate synthase family protein [Alphaproteobacteria bacterium]
RGVKMLQALDAPAYKIASFEAVDSELIELCASTGKPLIISTGLCNVEEIDEAVSAARRGGAQNIALLRCNSAYPADPKEANLATIPDMLSRFECLVGYSDHTMDAIQSMIAVGLGACIIEKHVIDAREPPTADSSFSCLPDQFGDLVKFTRSAWEARGDVSYGPQEKERASLDFRRSLFATRDIDKGETFSRHNVSSLRPGYGIAPKNLPQIIGRSATHPIKRGEPLSWEMIN